ncbi:MAG: glycosyltransferase family 2 protein [Chloroflexi bacterium]|nr:glycosyltransferase family 2 protein [Chloroflexota bacterium]
MVTRASPASAGDARQAEGPPSISVVICTNRPGHLHDAVASVLAMHEPPFDLTVIAQGGRPGWVHDDLRDFAGDARLRVVEDDGCGLSRARNIGIRATTGSLILFTDDDCEAAPDWIAAHAAIFMQQPAVGVIFGKVAPPRGYVESDGMVPTFDPVQERGTARLRGRIAFGIGANMAVRRSALERIGLYDEQLGPGGPLQSGDDFDFALRASAAGVRVIADERPVIIHAGGVRPAGDSSTTLWQRDGFAIGVVIAKQVRIRHRDGAIALVGFLGGIVWRAIRRVLRRKRPYGLSMALTLVRSGLPGLMAGLRRPLYGQGAHATYAHPG